MSTKLTSTKLHRSLAGIFLVVLGTLGGGVTISQASPSPSPSPSASPSPAPTPSVKCNCDAGAAGYSITNENGTCYKQECVTKNTQCSSVGKAYSVPGLLGPRVQVACPAEPPKPPGGNGSTQGGKGGGTTGTKPSASPTATPTATPEARCPGPDDENEFGLSGDGGKIGECQDGQSAPIPGRASIPDPDAPGVCYSLYMYCVEGCWFYDNHGVNPIPDDCE